MKVQDLTLVGLTEDKQQLVLVSDSGEKFNLPADARLRAALRGDHARLGQLEITMDSALRPRDIQARIRAGESPENVAADAQTSLDRVMGYATPVLAERAHIAQSAQRASVRRKAGERTTQALADAIAETLHSRHVDPSAVEWDAWRRDDGRWTLVADYGAGESAGHAEFVYDAPGRYVVADDDEARWLVGDQTAQQKGPRATIGPRRLSAVGDDDVELPLGEDALGLVAEPAQAPVEEAEESAEALSETSSLLRASGDADWIATQASERPVPAQGSAQGSAQGAAQGSAQGAAQGSSAPGRVELGSEADEADAAPTTDAEQPAARRATKRSRRPSVPSWDEIMFGGKPE